MKTPKTSLVAVLLALAVPPAVAGGSLADYDPPLTPELRERLAQADLAAGARFFERKCSQCHDGTRDGAHAKGPLLWNVFGRKAGTIAGFVFSDAMRKSGHTWNFATLDYYLADTEVAVPGKAMDFVGIPDAKLRAAVVAYVRTLNDAPPPLP
ncbi:c-type cytochrome [Sulfurisoma sediminicola]|uniref:Cytochrome c n=1 Tax=Sulfurisoma sediminicola TaxID=1381557 RepID=A0A497X8T7_9PROT|nr:c-type cytochrome [Sulfurisoma sediminicola]RLJ62642.1 cytochrome c [Sulfurisoma sediminicola]